MEANIPISDEGCVTVEISELSVYGHHGVSESERNVGQRLVFDISFELEHCDAVLTDRVEDTVDYSKVCDLVAAVATARSYRTLERLCQTVADRLLDHFTDARAVTIRAAKPEPPIAHSVKQVAVELDKERVIDEDEHDA